MSEMVLQTPPEMSHCCVRKRFARALAAPAILAARGSARQFLSAGGLGEDQKPCTTSKLHGRGLEAKFDTAAPAATAARATLFSQKVGHLRQNLQYWHFDMISLISTELSANQ